MLFDIFLAFPFSAYKSHTLTWFVLFDNIIDNISVMTPVSNDWLLAYGICYLFFILSLLHYRQRSKAPKSSLKNVVDNRIRQNTFPWRLPILQQRYQYIYDDFLSKYYFIPPNILKLQARKKLEGSHATEKENFGSSKRAHSTVASSPKADKSSVRTSNASSSLVKTQENESSELPGDCVNELHKRYPSATRLELTRFLIARKGNVDLAAEMFEKALVWRNKNLPVKRSLVEEAIKTGCFSAKGFAKDGTPIIYFVWGLYDTARASPEAFILAAVHTIELLCRDEYRNVKVTVVASLYTVPGGANASLDMNFIKGFSQVGMPFMSHHAYFRLLPLMMMVMMMAMMMTSWTPHIYSW